MTTMKPATMKPATLEAAVSGTAIDIEAPVAELFPDALERRRIEDRLTLELARADERVASGPVTPSFDAGTFARELAGYDFAAPRDLDEALTWSIGALEHGVTHMTHPSYFGLFNPAPAFPSQCADRIVATFNPQLAAWPTSPAAVEIEAHVIRAVARRAGLPEGSSGHFTSGGSEANETALVLALTRAEPRFATDGARGFSGQPVLYVSADSHLAWLKMAHVSGIGRAAVRLVATDGAGRMDVARLEAAIADDRGSGRVPVMIAATAGTTNAGMIDPLRELAAVAARESVWLHVDAAWAGAMIASERLSRHLAGLELGDSVTIDAHKWLATTMGCGMLLVRDAALLKQAFHVATTYMPSPGLDRDPFVTSLLWSRRFMGLRLFLNLAAAGWAGYARHVERAVHLSRLIADGVAAKGWSVANDSPCGVVCMVPPEGRIPPATIVRHMLARGDAWVSLARYEGREVVRACVTHGRTDAGDVDRLVACLESASEAGSAEEKC